MSPILAQSDAWFIVLVVVIWVVSWWLERQRKRKVREAQLEAQGRAPSRAAPPPESPYQAQKRIARQKAVSSDGYAQQDSVPLEDTAQPEPAQENRSDWASSYGTQEKGHERSGYSHEAEDYEAHEVVDEQTYRDVDPEDLPDFIRKLFEDRAAAEEAEAEARRAPYRPVPRGSNLEVRLEDVFSSIEDIAQSEIGSAEIYDVIDDGIDDELLEGDLMEKPLLQTDSPKAKKEVQFFQEHFPKGFTSAVIGHEILKTKRRSVQR